MDEDQVQWQNRIREVGLCGVTIKEVNIGKDKEYGRNLILFLCKEGGEHFET